MADVNQIYNRLNNGTQYVPLSADTFGDWSMEAGDIVTVRKDGKTYTTPVMTGHMVWNGACRMEIESTGNQKRDPLSKQSKQQYSDGVRGGGGYYGAKRSGEDHAWIEDTDDHVALVAEKIFGYGPDGKPNWSQIAQIKVDADGIRGTVEETKNGLTIARSEIKQTKNSISAVVDGDGVITPASLIMAINGNQSSIKLKADQIAFDGYTTINDILRVTGQSVNIIVPTMIGSSNPFNSVGITGGKLIANSVNIRVAGGSSVEMNLLDASVKGNVLTITRANGPPINFSKAANLKGSWSGGTFTASAATGEKLTTSLVAAPAKATRTGNTINIPVYATIGSSGTVIDTGKPAFTTVGQIFDDMSITRVIAGVNTQGSSVYFGKLYYYNNVAHSYIAASDSNHYWYYSGTSRSGTNTVYY